MLLAKERKALLKYISISIKLPHPIGLSIFS